MQYNQQERLWTLTTLSEVYHCISVQPLAPPVHIFPLITSQGLENQTEVDISTVRSVYRVL